MRITILFGTETGNAEMLAEDIQAELEASHEVDRVDLQDMDPEDFDPGRFYLVVCSTYGEGDLPASAKPFAEALDERAPDLSEISFAIFGLGDMEYAETFNGGPKQLAERLIARGATQIGERAAHDASGPELAEDMAISWARDVVALAADRLGEDA